MSSMIRKFIRLQTPCCSFLARHVNTSEFKLTEKDIEEIRIPMPWGHLAGKWWGSKDKQPIICMHGWQDNANTFDTLIPLLPPKFSYLAIDLPGQGRSPHFPKGIYYKTYENITTIRRVQHYFNLSEVSFIGHSLGAICSFIFSSVFPDDVNFFVAIDAIKPVSQNIDKELKHSSVKVEKLLMYDSYNFSNSPAYTRDDLTKRWTEATNNSLTEQSCKILMERGAEETNGLYKLTRDCRLKLPLLTLFSKNDGLLFAESIKCNVLYIKAKDEPYLEDKEEVIKVLNIIRKKAKYFEEHNLPGTHHLHLNNPEIVAPVISSFIESITKD